MYRTRAASVALAVSLLCVPIFVRADAISDLRQQLAALLQQIQTLQAQQVGTTTNSVPAVTSSYPMYGSSTFSGETEPTCFVPLRTMSRGNSGPDVVLLQRYLIAHGVLAAGSDAGYFGPLTEAAVQTWQAQQGIVSSGSPATTGYGVVGSRTQVYFKSLCGPGQRPEAFCNTMRIPASTCSTSWVSVNDALGCTIAYKCSPLSVATSTSGVCSPTVLLTCPTGSILQMGADCSQYCSLVVGSQ